MRRPRDRPVWPAFPQGDSTVRPGGRLHTFREVNAMKNISPWLVLLVVMVPAAQAGEFKNVSECAIGKRVSDRNGVTGAVTEIRSGMCVVRQDSGVEKSYLHWMLSPADGAKAPAVQGLQAGNYVCSAYGAGSFTVSVQAAGTYRDRAGATGRYRLKDGKEIRFESGSLSGQYSELLAPGKFGLASSQRKSFNTICNLKS